MQITTGHVERWRLVNGSARHLRLSLGVGVGLVGLRRFSRVGQHQNLAL